MLPITFRTEQTGAKQDHVLNAQQNPSGQATFRHHQAVCACANSTSQQCHAHRSNWLKLLEDHSATRWRALAANAAGQLEAAYDAKDRADRAAEAAMDQLRQLCDRNVATVSDAFQKERAARLQLQGELSRLRDGAPNHGLVRNSAELRVRMRHLVGSLLGFSGFG